jgi:glycine cleavage system H protein
MTVLLVLITLIAFLTVDYVLQRKKRKAFVSEVLLPVQTLAPSHWHITDDLVLAPNHTWLRREADNSITLGVDNLLMTLTGTVERIQLPIEGAIVSPQSPTVALHDKERSLRIASPIDGRIVAVNNELLHTPALAKSHPYTTGWLFKLMPSDNVESLRGFFSGEKAIEWLRKQSEHAKEFINQYSPQLQFATMQDGGMPVDGVLKGFDANVWRAFESKFLSMEPKALHGTRGEHDHA